MDMVLTFIAWLIGAAGMAYLWVLIFQSADRRVSDEIKDRIRKWFAPAASGDDEGKSIWQWTPNFIDIFDHVFGRVYSPWFFLRSMIATLLLTVIVTLVYIGFGVITWGSWEELLDNAGGFEEAQRWIIVTLIGNILADYVSLMETRLVLSLIARASPVIKILGILADAVLTFLIYMFFGAVFFGFESVMSGSSSIWDFIADEPGSFSSDWSSVYRYVVERYPSFGELHADMFRISVITTYFTSLWLWLFVIAGVLGRLVFSPRGRMTRIGNFFRVGKSPVPALGYTLAAITLVLHASAFAGWQVYDAVTPGEVAPGPETSGQPPSPPAPTDSAAEQSE